MIGYSLFPEHQRTFSTEAYCGSEHNPQQSKQDKQKKTTTTWCSCSRKHDWAFEGTNLGAQVATALGVM